MSSSTIQEGETNPLGFVKFFDPAKVGIEVVAIEGGMQIKKTHKGKPFARVDLRTGDVVLSVDGIVVNSSDSFRRILRRKFAEGVEVVFKVRRSDKVLEIPVLCKD